MISIKLESNFVEITLQHVCSPVHLLHIFRTPFSQEHLWRHGVKVGAGTRDPPQSLEVGPQDFLQSLKVGSEDTLQSLK